MFSDTIPRRILEGILCLRVGDIFMCLSDYNDITKTAEALLLTGICKLSQENSVGTDKNQHR